jgi:hypothetical protein
VTFSHHLEEPFQLEDIKANIKSELWKRNTMFLLATDSKIMEQLNKREGNYDIEILDSISERLMGILQTSIPKLMPGYLDQPESILQTKNYDILAGKNKFVGAFHRDGVQANYIIINVWIALEDVTARPLAFVKSAGMPLSSPYGGHPDYDPNGDYIIVPNMKKGQMFIFVASQKAHGSPIIGGDDGARFSVVFTYVHRVY